MGLYQICSNEGTRFQDGSAPRGPRFKQQKYIIKHKKYHNVGGSISASGWSGEYINHDIMMLFVDLNNIS